MKKLVKIKLINWHLFSNQTVQITDNSLLSGENGAGKSTFLDAIQYVLTAGKAKFNTAANTRAKRDLEGYVRCKLGLENKTYLRSNDVISHVALEFNDTVSNKSIIIGVVIEVNKNGRIYERFYLIKNCSIRDDLFIENNLILGYANFKQHLLDRGIDIEFCDTKEQTRNLFLLALGIKNYKYIELIPKALAFRPIEELNKFVFDFLLNEKKVSLDEIKFSLRSYYEFENLLKSLKEKEVLLTKIATSNNTYHTCLENIEVYKKLSDYVNYEDLRSKKKTLLDEIENISEKIESKREEEKKLEEKIGQIEKEIIYLTGLINKNETYSVLKDIGIELEEKKAIEKELKQNIRDLQEIIKNEMNLANFVYDSLDHNMIIKDFLKALENPNEHKQVKKLVHQIKDIYQNGRDHLIITIGNLKNSMNDAKHDLEKTNIAIEQLNKNQFSFERPVTRLKSLIEDQLMNKYFKEIKVNVLCEVVQIKDELWRNACEGYLNTQRFDLIIEPVYFDEAVTIYETHKYKEKLYGVGLVNTQKLDAYKQIYDKSLAAKIETENEYARNYVNMLLNNVICCDDVNELKQYKTAITKTCMVYKNYTVRQIKEDIYQKPYIGMDAIKQQLKVRLERKSELEDTLAEYKNKVNKLSFSQERLKSNQLDHILHHIDDFISYQKIIDEISILENRHSQLTTNFDGKELHEDLQNKKVIIKKIEDHKKQVLLEEGKLLGELEIKKLNLEVLEGELNHKKTSLHEDVYNMFTKLLEDCKQNIKKVKGTIDELTKQNDTVLNKTKMDIITYLNEFNHKYHFGLDARLENMDGFLIELDKIKNYQLIEYEEKAKESRIQCEIAFKEQFIYRLRENILNACEELNHLNQALKGKKFGGDEYEFIYKPNPPFLKYYQIIMSDENVTQSLFSEEVDDQKKVVLRELFDQLIIERTDEEKESTLTKYTDYRNYMTYDIKIHHHDGQSTLFSKVSREKSGGETQTPFYVVIAASFEQLLSEQKNRYSPACFVMFDEAFNNMDESRIQAMMEFYHHLNIQLMIAVPPQRIDTILPHVNTTLIVLKDKEQSFIETFTYQNEKNIS